MAEEWICAPSCPIRLLDEQGKAAGVHAARNKTETVNHRQGNKVYAGEWTPQNNNPDYYGSDGDSNCSRFFQTFPPETEDNLIEPVQKQTSVQILRGDCVEEMAKMPPDSIDSVVCDPPYFLRFMSRKWDTAPTPQEQQRQHEAWAREALRVLRPGGFLLAFGGTRTVHRLACAIEDAGFEIRDRYLNIGGDAVESIPGEIAWVYGSGFPKSANIEKLMTKAQGQKRRAHGMVPLAGPQSAQMHAGIGSATKPAYEPIVVARKPLSEKNLVQNILKHGEWLEDGTVYKVGTGGLNIDQSRVQSNGAHGTQGRKALNGHTKGDSYLKELDSNVSSPNPAGRFPANLLLSHVPGPNGCVRVGSRRVKGQKSGSFQREMTSRGYEGGGLGQRKAKDHEPVSLDKPGYADPDGLEEVPEYICAEGCAVRALDEMSGVSKSPKPYKYNGKKSGGFTNGDIGQGIGHDKEFGDAGGPSRFFQQFHDPNPGFFYSPKASRAERNRGLEGMPEKKNDFQRATSGLNQDRPGRENRKPMAGAANHHPCVKPLSLMRYLLKLVTPENGTCLDPFAGSGTSGVAALSEGFNAILIEAESEYAEIAERRCAHALSEIKKGEVKTAKEWGLENVHPQDTPLRYNPDECPEEGGTYSPVELEEFSGRLPF